MITNMVRVGDRVEFKVDPKDDYYPSKGDPANGMQGTVVERERITLWEDRVGLVVRPAGVYECDGPIIVRWDDGVVSQPNGWLTKLIDQDEDKRRWAEYRAQIKAGRHWVTLDDEYDNRTFISKLPDTKVWEGDFVAVVYVGRNDVVYNEFGIIEGIDYHMMADRGEGQYRYRIVDENREEKGGSSYTCDSRIELIERGNVYKYFNGQRDQIVFKDLNDEASFFSSLGHSQEVRNDINGLYSWTLKEVLQAIRDDKVDCFHMSGGMFGALPKISAKRFNDRELGARLQAETLKGFADTDIDALDEKSAEREREWRAQLSDFGARG